MAKFLQGLGNHEQNREVTLEELKSDAWKELGRQVLEMLTKDSRADLRTFKQLTIVPDGILWYLPFEALPVRDGDKLVPLGAKVAIHYLPLASLAGADPRPRRTAGTTAVVIGRLMHGGDEAPAAEAFEEISQVLPGSVALRPPFPADIAAYATLFDNLIVLNDIPSPEANPYDSAPVADRNAGAATLTHWFPLPWGGPDVVVLPSYHTAAERSLKKYNTGAPGDDVFLTVCGLMANGTRTILLSRWRTGGHSSTNLVREFVQELPHMSADDAWQRSVSLATSDTLDRAGEPRLRLAVREEAPKADHPFFWAGYQLIDTGALPQEAAAERQEAKPAAADAADKPPEGKRPAADAAPVPTPDAPDPNPAPGRGKARRAKADGKKEPDALSDDALLPR